jgi:2-isopropylmalate synthase
VSVVETPERFVQAQGACLANPIGGSGFAGIGLSISATRSTVGGNMDDNDPLRKGLRSGGLAFCEEVARDGAQAKTLLDARQRIEIARRHSSLLGAGSEERLVFSAGFPAIAPQEFEIVRQLAAEVDTCQLMVVSRANRVDIDQAIRSLKGASCGRLFILAPMSEPISQVMCRGTVQVAVREVMASIEYAKCQAPELHMDIALVDAPRADAGVVADAASLFTEVGGAAMVLCDTVGTCTPLMAGRIATEVLRRVDDNVLVGAHMHNDLGFGLASTFAMLQAGVRYVASSWLGLGERSGLAATEQLLVALGSDPGANEERYGIGRGCWPETDLTSLRPLASDIARWLDIPFRVTDPVVGSGVNSISTGTPFQDPMLFAPYDAERLLAAPPQIVVTHLASRRVMREVAKREGLTASAETIAEATRLVKDHCYERNQARVDPSTTRRLLERARTRVIQAPEAGSTVAAKGPPPAVAVPAGDQRLARPEAAGVGEQASQRSVSESL